MVIRYHVPSVHEMDFADEEGKICSKEIKVMGSDNSVLPPSELVVSLYSWEVAAPSEWELE